MFRSREKKKSRMNKVLFPFSLLLLILGISLTGYSLFQMWESNQSQKQAISEAEALLSAPKGDGENNKDSANLDSEPVSVPEYIEGDTLGILEVPKLQEKLPIVEGTDEEQLDKGVGHYIGTTLPDQNDQIVLSGHRDTVFRRFDELAIGDHFIVNLEYGSFTYEIVSTKIVDADDLTVIKSTAPEEILTVTTCYPFGFIGDAPDRFIFTAKRVPNDH
jgi:sortase A